MNVDLAERFQYAIPFTDKDGLLELAPKQKLDFARWCRPEELFSDPKMVVGPQVDYYSIKQNVSLKLKRRLILFELNVNWFF